MSNLLKLLTTIFIMNLFMYLGVNISISAENGRGLNKDYNFHFEGDLTDTFLSGPSQMDDMIQDYKENWTSYRGDFNNNFTGMPDQQGGILLGAGGINFLDSLKILWDFIKTLGNVLIAPLTLFFNFRMPVIIGILIGFPYFLMLILTFMAFIRGVGD